MQATGLGRVLFGLSFVLLGAFSIFFPGFAAAWPMVPKWMPGHDVLFTFSGALLLVGGILCLFRRTASLAALALSAILLVRLALLHVRPVIARPLLEGTWEELSESLVFLAGAWTIFSLSRGGQSGLERFGNVRLGQILFALALPAIGLSHFVYLGETAPLIPSWLPLHVPLAWFTGAAHIAAGLAILFLVLPGLAATLEAVMVSLFTLLVWVPMVFAAPGTAGNWSELGVSAAISGAAWAVAESFRTAIAFRGS